jgi:hypothetical protein
LQERVPGSEVRAPMKVRVLVSVATIVKQIAHQGTERPVRT